MPVPFLDLQTQYHSLKSELEPAIQDVIESSSFALGPAVERFERAFADYCGAAHCIGVNSGTAALALLLKAYGVGPGDEVILPTNTFIATAEAASHVGATPVLVDCEEETALMDVTKLEAAITMNTKAIIPVHLYGQCADMHSINAIAKKHDLIVVEDACQAHGATLNGKKAGSLGHAAAFSFYPGKNLGAFGEAGAVVTNDANVARTIRMLRDHGQSRKYHHDLIGWNERMDGIQSAVLSVKLEYLDEWNARRRRHAAQYRKLLKGVGDIRFFEALADSEHVYHLFVIRTVARDALQEHLKKRGIETGIHYPIPIHLQRAYGDLPYGAGDFPIAEMLSSELLSLPMFPELKEGQIEESCNGVQTFFKKEK
jgi:dTDP-4-amino-4,6-dideoxygalactose transaminase